MYSIKYTLAILIANVDYKKQILNRYGWDTLDGKL